MEPANNLVKNLVRAFREQLSGLYPEQEIRQFVYILFEEYLGWQKDRIHLYPDAEIPPEIVNAFARALEDLRNGRPVQYVTGKAWFNGKIFRVDGSVLVPRPETEQLCSMIKADFADEHDQPFSVLDIGTGSGCIAVDLKTEFPNWEVTAMDISGEALATAGHNARSNRCEISLIRADILDRSAWENLGKFNMMVSNPPYVLESERIRMHRNVIGYEPHGALFVADDDPLEFYRSISAFASLSLVPPARLYLEINERFGPAVCRLVQVSGFRDVKVSKDFQGKDRFVSATLG